MTHVGSACAIYNGCVFKTTKAKATLSKLEATPASCEAQHGAIGMVGIIHTYIYIYICYIESHQFLCHSDNTGPHLIWK